MKNLELRLGKQAGDNKRHVLICEGTGCLSADAAKIEGIFADEVKKNNLADSVEIVRTGCFGYCQVGPIVIIYPEGSFYSRVKLEDIPKIVQEHLLGGAPVKDLLLPEAVNADGSITPFNDVPFYKIQKRVALRLCGLVNPENITEYIAFDGYQALNKVLGMKREDVIKEIKDSGLRGRGGGGFSTGMKWEFCFKTENAQKYVVCNADEGDPGAFMDRSILEGDPHSIIEAMAIAGYAIGANKGFVYVRAEYPIAVNRLQLAIDQAKDFGLLGEKIFDTDFAFDLEIRLGAGAFVCGEETALLNSIEGKRGMPNPRPPFPAVKGLWGKPTIINNVETFANIPQIILNGAAWLNAMGTEKSNGTKVFALGGKVENAGLIEVPMGTTIRDIVYEIGGGIPNGKEFKAVQIGGPSGGCLTKDQLDAPIDYDSLLELGAMMGSGGLVVMDEDNCMVDIARFFLEFTVDESCGKCPPCRVGTKRMLETLIRITEGKGEMEDLERLEVLANNIKASSLCGLGQTAPNPVLSTLRYFRDEYIAHVKDKKCPAGACTELLEFFIEDSCKGCTLCKKACPVDAIIGERKELHVIDQEKCVKCGACIPKCPFKSIVKK
ncbi:MAG: NADH-quinone oxidoreductase subunit NuoF [Defluviitaleaceae bacterium]|nr:NADH-quinone oxidoreductase subunit NuoF [Defluviitaleaceae bacterium]MCL2263050.1 NADH-quinone oxidoreductase subunit NuoF [Defluviitaleaceae bacterium]